MTAAGLLARTTLQILPPAVRYDLTDLGVGFLQPLAAMASWVADNRDLLAKRPAPGGAEPVSYRRRREVSTIGQADAGRAEDAESLGDAGRRRDRSTAESAVSGSRLGPRFRQAVLEQLGEADLEGVRDLP